MLSLKKQSIKSSQHYSEVLQLYLTAFPAYERRDVSGFEEAIENQQKLNVCAIIEDEKFAGLISYWEFEQFTYIEHFAIAPQFRGQNIGTDAMKLFISQNTLPIVFEVETPNNDIATRRIHFYERLGFYMLYNHYMQPPYKGNAFLLTMLIMSNDYKFASENFEMVKATLYEQVYQYNPKLIT